MTAVPFEAEAEGASDGNVRLLLGAPADDEYRREAQHSSGERAIVDRRETREQQSYISRSGVNSTSDQRPYSNDTRDSKLRRRFQKLKEFEPGWDRDGGGESLDSSENQRFFELIETVMKELGLPRPRLAPKPDGTLRAEWPLQHTDLSVELLEDQRVYIHSYPESASESRDWVLEPAVTPKDLCEVLVDIV